MCAPRLVLDVDVDVRMLRLEGSIGEGNRLGPTALRLEAAYRNEQ